MTHQWGLILSSTSGQWVRAKLDRCCRNPEGWGPYSEGRFDPTLCFEYSTLLAASIVFAVVFWSRIYSLQKLPDHGLDRSKCVFILSQICMTTAALLLLVLAAWSYTIPPTSPVAVTSLVVSGIAWAIAARLNVLVHSKAIRSSSEIFLFYIVSIAHGALLARTHRATGVPGQDYSLAILGILVVGVVVETCPQSGRRAQQLAGRSLYDKANLLSRVTMYFFWPMIKRGTREIFTLDEVQSELVGAIKDEQGYRWFAAIWEARARPILRAGPEAANQVHQQLLFWTILWAYRKRLIPLVVLSVVISMVKFVPPFLLGKLMDYLQGTGGREQPLEYGVGLVLGMALGSVSCALLTAYSRLMQTNMTTEIRATLAAMVFRKALVLSPRARQQSTTGEILNHMTKDVEWWSEGVNFMTQLLSYSLDIIVALFLLYRTIGYTAVGTLIGICLVAPLHVLRAKIYSRLVRTKLQFMDERVRRITETLSGIKVVKLYGWETAHLERIRAARESELSVLRKIGVLIGIMSIIFISAPVILSLLTFSMYALWGGPDMTPGTLTPKIVFVSLTIFKMLRRPIGKLAESTNYTINTLEGMKRIQKYLLREELEPCQIDRRDGLPSDKSPMVAIQHATFSWHGPPKNRSRHGNSSNTDKIELEKRPLLGDTNPTDDWTDQPTLEDISLEFPQSQLTAIVGRVGQGKSSLLSAMLGEMYKWQGSVTMYGRVAYVPQHAWIINATVRDNILFSKDYDPDRYRRVVAACGLVPDLAILPAGDMTEIGERGINLSGGQKQRVSLARAAYADADVYLLDDPLSAVDAHVDKHLWDKLIGPKGLLGSKTRVLVTHGIHHLRHVDQIVVLKDGKVAEQGRYSELMDQRQIFYQLIKEYSVTERRSCDQAKASVESIEVCNEPEQDDTSRSSSISEIEPVISDPAQEDDSEPESTDTEDTATDAAEEMMACEDMTEAKQGGEAELIKKELLRAGKVGFDVAMVYVRSLSFTRFGAIIALYVVAHFCNMSGTLWLKRWASSSRDKARDESDEISVTRLLAVYSAFSLSYVLLFVVIQTLMFAFARVRASRLIHDNLLKRIMRLPMSFFDTTPLGRLLTRFSSDMLTMDDRMPWHYMDVVNFGISALAALGIVLYSTPLVTTLFPLLLFGLYMVQWYFVRAAAFFKRLNETSKSPLYSHFHEILGGVATIRAMQGQASSMARNQAYLQRSSAAWTLCSFSDRWLEVHLRLLSASLGLAVTTVAVYGRDRWSSTSLVGLAMTHVLTWADDMVMLVCMYGALQNCLVGLERIQEYTEMAEEAPAHTEAGVKVLLPEQWPQNGRLSFQHYSTRYRQGTELVLRDVSFEVQAGEKVGIVGRTGAGKSSLALALFRIIEAANSRWSRQPSQRTDASPATTVTTKLDASCQTLQQEKSIPSDYSHRFDECIDGGKIEVDGVDISTVGLEELRRQLAIIPQDPVLFAGTVRENLDPFKEHLDAEILEALERASLKTLIETLPGGLSFEVAQQGENFSIGQRSLLCLARALLRRHAKILVMDEATSSVDMVTDELIQRTIRTEFRDRTILTIAHRIKTVMDYDKILVLDQGQVKEFDTPRALLENRESLFYRLALQAGEVQE